jgi:hydrogenase maturation protein HypF
MAAFTGIKKIALSGGVFQNTVLIDMIQELSKDRFELFFNINLAPNDENISYGQVMYYSNLMADKKLTDSKEERVFHIKQEN